MKSHSGLVYNLSIDLSQTKSKELMQIEIEYLRSAYRHSEPLDTILHEIDELGEHLQKVSESLVKRSFLRKEDWVVS